MSQTSNPATSPATPPAAPAAPERKSDGKKKGNVSGVEMTARFMQQMQETHNKLAAEKLPGDAPAPAAPAASAPPPGAEAAQPPAPPTEVPPVTAPPDPEPDAAEVDTPPDLSQFSHLDPKTQELVQSLLEAQKKRTQEAVDRRIGKEVAKRKALEEKIAGGSSPATPPNVPQVPAVPAMPPSADQPLADITDPAQLLAKQQEARLYRQKADDALALGPDDQGRYVIDGTALSKEQVVAVRRNATDTLEVHVPQRYQFLMQRQQALGAALQEFPWLKDQQSPEYQQAIGLIKQAPHLAYLPNAEMVIGTLVEGLKAREARKKPAAPAAAPAKPRPPSDQPAMGGSAAGPARAPADTHTQRALASELEKLKASKGVRGKDMAAYLARRDQLSQQR